MNRNEILNTIGYHGEYNDKVKKEIRKLLKKYHPDHNNGNSETFKLINKIRKELEKGKKLTNSNINNYKKDRSDDWYYQNKINNLMTKVKELEEKINKKNNVIEEYKDLCDKVNEVNINNSQLLCDNNYDIRKLKSFKKRFYIYITFLAIILILLILLKQKYFIFPIIFIAIIITFDAISLSIKMKNALLKTKKCLNNSVVINKKYQALDDELKKQKLELLNLERELNHINDDIRFCQNQIQEK